MGSSSHKLAHCCAVALARRAYGKDAASPHPLELDDGMKGYLPGIVGGIAYGSKGAVGPDP